MEKVFYIVNKNIYLIPNLYYTYNLPTINIIKIKGLNVCNE